jgi:hypothetical protein
MVGGDTLNYCCLDDTRYLSTKWSSLVFQTSTLDFDGKLGTILALVYISHELSCTELELD